MARKISLKDFEAAAVCQDGFIHFRAAFGEEVEVTEATCRAMAGKLNFAFGADKFLRGAQRAAYLAEVGPAAIEAAIRLQESKQLFERELGTDTDAEKLRTACKNREAREAPIRRAHEVKQAIAFARAYNMDP